MINRLLILSAVTALTVGSAAASLGSMARRTARIALPPNTSFKHMFEFSKRKMYTQALGLGSFLYGSP